MELRRRLGEILDAASAGERIRIERDGRPMAFLVSVEDGRRFDEDEKERIKRALDAIDRLDDFRERMAREHPPVPGDEHLDAAAIIRQGRQEREDRIVRAGAGRPPDHEEAG